MRWKYEVLNLYGDCFEDLIKAIDSLKEYGEAGWELVAVENGIFYLKRQMDDNRNN